MEKDPVCGMDVDPKTAQWKSDYQGHTYYFCAAGCKSEFDREPKKFIQPASGSAPSAASDRH